ncbi:hypothetical protein BCR36DRAFT_397721 [Piromyces finnis]|uniref:Galactosyl transferase n=1 Tax=Piromyces finnis TaxID=1754191 RepID=A0A1Y1V811_9FUNG|nr:hypothetical protein BCR36DRAFT_397721 [Piromyces finnis]|eukprot:ORX49598.1 hypothetical protein BCR36DRAFT_397721 [Piromyces finnis]
MLFNKVKSNSIYENAISEIYQYSKIHNYDLKINNMVYNKDKNIYFMKLSVILETIVEGLKENNYDWIFWVDSDVTITNPKIKLETFLPTDNEVHFIAASDRNGLNAGVFFMRVHQWSYNVLIDSLSYPYYNKGKFLRFAEQTCLNNILSENTQQNHYVIVPNSWFNRYLNSRIKGEFLIHFAGAKFKDRKSRNLRKEINNEWFDATNNEILRNEVLEYYKRPKKNQAYGGIFKELNYD